MSKRSRYRLLGLVGQGQFGRVFCAVHRQTGRLVALKSLDHERFSTHKFLRELRFLLSLRHPNIVGCQAIEHTSTGRHLVMDYCEGGTLRRMMSEEKRLSLSQSLKLIGDVLEGLAHAHSRGIVHCDIKPENILLKVQPLGWTAQLSDFGIARLSQANDSRRACAIEGREKGNTGSPAYMAPERFYGEYSPSSDLYSVGVILYELLAGHRPFAGTPAELMSAHLNQPVMLPDTIPTGWQPFIATALGKLSARRFQTAEDMLLTLRSIAKEVPADASATLLPQSAPLLEAISQPPDCLFQLQRQQPLHQPTVALLPTSSSLYQAQPQQIVYTEYALGFLAAEAPVVEQLYSLAQPPEALWLRPQGCFVVTERSLHLISPAATALCHTLLELPQVGGIAIAPQGNWAASLIPHQPQQSYLLHIHRLDPLAQSPSMPAASVELMFKAAATPPKLFALDQRHVAIAFEESGAAGGTLIKVLTRRGKRSGSLLLPLRIKHFTLTATPYQLLTVDRNHPDLLTLVDLKPYRITRLAAGIAADFLATTDWGYIVANRQGEVALLDLEGRQVGLMKVPGSITAIAPFEQHGLWVATWAEESGSLYAIDLREIGADLLF